MHDGHAFKELSRTEEAPPHFRCVVELEPRHPVGVLNLDVIALASGQFETARNPLRRALPIDSELGRTHVALAHISFTAARNTPFQGLAAAGAKLSLYELIRAGYTVNAFIHDEFILTIRNDANWKTVPRDIERIVCQQMQSVCGTVPIAAEGAG